MSSDQILSDGQPIRTESSDGEGLVTQLLGAGGQGEVYRVALEGRSLALKWFFPVAATAEQRSALAVLVRQGPPNDKFLWPMDLATAPGKTGFGYLMPLREERYKGIVDMMKRRIEPGFLALATAGLDLAHSYLQLHSRGLCYRDISFGNVFFDPERGDILICDNDNVAVDGAAAGGVLGTPRFMAPEVVRGDALPSIQTDLFSLAVLLFYIFMVHHPLEGRKEAAIKCLDLPAMTRLYGTEPLFIFDPADRANEPVPGMHDNALAFWPIYPRFLRDLFTRSFTAGLRDPQNSRVRESEWRAAMARLRDALLYCAGCDAENFYDIEGLKASGGTPPPCWACAVALRLPPRLRVGRHIVMLRRDALLYPHHLDEVRLYDFSAVVAAMTPGGLKNVSPAAWTVTEGDDPPRSVAPGDTLALAASCKVRFGQAEGEVRL